MQRSSSQQQEVASNMFETSPLGLHDAAATKTASSDNGIIGGGFWLCGISPHTLQCGCASARQGCGRPSIGGEIDELFTELHSSREDVGMWSALVPAAGQAVSNRKICVELQGSGGCFMEGSMMTNRKTYPVKWSLVSDPRGSGNEMRGLFHV